MLVMALTVGTMPTVDRKHVQVADWTALIIKPKNQADLPDKDNVTR